MFHFMHESWSNAQNGGPNVLFHNAGAGHFEKMDMAAMGNDAGRLYFHSVLSAVRNCG
jgi:hypothetical protein